MVECNNSDADSRSAGCLAVRVKDLGYASWRTNIQHVFVGGGRATSFPIYTPGFAGLSRDGLGVTRHTAHLLLSGLLVSAHDSKDSQLVSFSYSAFYLWNRSSIGQGWCRWDRRGVRMEIITVIILGYFLCPFFPLTCRISIFVLLNRKA